MNAVPRVAIIGFSAFERSTLESFFRLCTPGLAVVYDADQLMACDLIVADADQPAAIYAVGRTGRVPDAVFVGGACAPATAGAHLARPVDALQIRRALDALAGQRARRWAARASPSGRAAAQAAQAAQTVQAVRSAGRLAAPALARHARPSGRVRQLAADASAVVQDFHRSSGFSNTVLVEGELRLDEVLVVSASPAERRLLHDLLQRYGYRVALAPSVDAALQASERTTYGFVFLGMGQDGLQSLRACRGIERHPTLTGLAPVVVALVRRHAAIDRIRASFAGCDAYLGAPLDEEDLLRVLAQHDPTFERTFEPTALLGL
jgi:CheY-like chemotaxis protein